MAKKIGNKGYKLTKREEIFHGDLTFNGGTSTGELRMSAALTAQATSSILGNFKYITTSFSGSSALDYSSLAPGDYTIMVNYAEPDDSAYIRLPEATTANAGQIIKVVYGLQSNRHAVGFTTTKIIGGAVSIADASAGQSGQDNAYTASDANGAKLSLDLSGSCSQSLCGSPGTELQFFYPGVADVVLFRGDCIGNIDAANDGDGAMFHLFNSQSVIDKRDETHWMSV